MRIVLVPSISTPGLSHRVPVTPDGIALGCTCPAGVYNRRCHHQRTAEQLAGLTLPLPVADMAPADSCWGLDGCGCPFCASVDADILALTTA